jgi:hypothetical protein
MRVAFMKRLFFTFLAGLLTCALTISIANLLGGKYWSSLYAALLGISSTTADMAHQRAAGIGAMALAASLVSVFFVLAEALRSRNSWLRWVGYLLWAMIALASLWWSRSPAI